MRLTLAHLAIAALAAAWCAPAASVEPTIPVPGQVKCKDGRVVGIRVLVPVAGVVVVQWPADACTKDAPAAAPPREPASSAPATRT